MSDEAATSAATASPTTQATIAVAPGVHASSGAGSVVSMLGSLAVVVALIFALAWLARRLQGFRASRNDLLQVTGGVSVGGKERVVIVKVGNDHFLVGVAAGQVSLLHRFAAVPGTDCGEPSSGEVPDPAAAPFADRLREILRARKAA